MAKRIIAGNAASLPAQAAESSASQLPNIRLDTHALTLPEGVSLRHGAWYDEYDGPTEALIALGVVAREQIPPPPSTQATYYDGKLYGRGSRGFSGRDKDERYKRVIARRAGQALTVQLGLTREESIYRRELAEAQDKADELRIARKVLAEVEEKDRQYRSDPKNLREQADLALRLLARIVGQHTEGVEQGECRTQHFCRFPAEAARDAQYHIRELEIWLESVEISRPASPVVSPVTKARKDQAFQSFLQSQCLGGAGGDHV